MSHQLTIVLPLILCSFVAIIGSLLSRKLIELIKAEIRLRETKIEELAGMIDSLEQKIKDQSNRLDI